MDTMIAVAVMMTGVADMTIAVVDMMIVVEGTMIAVVGTMIAAAGTMIAEPHRLATTATIGRDTMTALAAIDMRVVVDVIARLRLVASMKVGRGGTTKGTEARRVGGMTIVRREVETGTGMGQLASKILQQRLLFRSTVKSDFVVLWKSKNLMQKLRGKMQTESKIKITRQTLCQS